jgi:cell division protein FtsL
VNPSLFVLEPQQQNIQMKRGNRRVPRYLRLLITCLGIYLVFSFAIGGYQIWQIKKQVNTLEKEQFLLQSKHQELEQEIKSLDTPEVIEKLAREGLGMVKPGESLLIPAVPQQGIPKLKSNNATAQDIAD